LWQPVCALALYRLDDHRLHVQVLFLDDFDLAVHDFEAPDA